MPAPVWRLLDTPPARGAWNMAVDAALVESVRAGGAPVLRFYRWDPPCLSLGRNQPAAGRYDLDALRARGIDVVRRPTGGRAVLHHRELTYSVVAAEGVLGGPRESYALINRALVAGLRRLGVAAGLQPRTGRRAAAPSLAPCFQEPAEGEVVAAGRKLVGSAQRREGGVVLQHGSLLLAGDQGEVHAVTLGALPPDGDDLPPTSLAELCDPVPPWERITATLAEGWSETVGGGLREEGLTPEERESAERLARHFDDPAWTWHT
ncbi:MAG TPA: biotin/lipoate A/B protein ligase family protein [Longimicrobiaceae bacterium]|nr:biotin/lipoate A/B protein ligase family protein [Longimicrobiaceae bacterium]